MSDFQNEVVTYANQFYRKKGTAPSISQIIKNVKNCSRSKLYDSFNGITDICTKAGIPTPMDRIEKIKNVNKRTNSIKRSIKNNVAEIKLTKNQITRINMISHLEKGKSPATIVNNLLNIDSLIRKDNLNFNNFKEINNYISEAKKRGFDPLNLLSLQILLNNAGFEQLNKGQREKLLDIAIYLNSQHMNSLIFIQTYNRNIKLISIVNDYLSNKIDLNELSLKMSQI